MSDENSDAVCNFKQLFKNSAYSTNNGMSQLTTSSDSSQLID
jgi:hypothetical protein